MLINAGITEIIYIEEYEDDLAAQLVEESKMVLRQVEVPRDYGRNSDSRS
jgi:deoxycytidylate deaminase